MSFALSLLLLAAPALAGGVHGRVTDRQSSEIDFLSREYGVGDFYRSFQVSDQIDTQKISADLAQGVLTLHLPKVEAAKPRKIAVAAR